MCLQLRKFVFEFIMKIAFISYEYPPDTSFGGIATYVHQAARMLHKRGHQVEIFAGSPTRSYSDTDEGIRTHRIKTETHLSFADLVGPVFAGRHKTIQFDVLEGPDYLADAREAIRLVPDIPFVLKLHTPSLTVYQISHLCFPFLEKGSIIRPSYTAWHKARLGLRSGTDSGI